MARLAKVDIENMAKRYVGAKFDALDAAHRELAVEPITAALDAFYGAAELKQFRELPKQFHTLVTEIEFRCAETGRVGAVRIPNAVVLPHGSRRVTVDRALADQLCDWLDEKKRLSDDRRKLVDTTRATLLALGTPARVQSEWPAIASYLPAPVKPLPLAILPSSIDAAIEHATTPAPTARSL